MKPVLKQLTHIVFKIKDCEDYLSQDQQAALVNISKTIIAGRTRDGKEPTPSYLVVNTDETYAADVQAVILSNMEEK